MMLLLRLIGETCQKKKRKKQKIFLQNVTDTPTLPMVITTIPTPTAAALTPHILPQAICIQQGTGLGMDMDTLIILDTLLSVQAIHLDR